MQFIEHILVAALFGPAAFIDNFHPNPFGQHIDGRHEINFFIVHHEAEHIPSGSAAEAVEDLAGIVDREGRGFFLMKGAVALVG